MCLVGTVVAWWSLNEEMANSSLFTVMTNIFWETFRRNSNVFINTAQMTNRMLKLIQFLAAVICQQIEQIQWNVSTFWKNSIVNIAIDAFQSSCQQNKLTRSITNVEHQHLIFRVFKWEKFGTLMRIIYKYSSVEIHNIFTWTSKMSCHKGVLGPTY